MREENDINLTEHSRAVQKLAGTIDQVAREKGVRGLANLFANIQKHSREAEWRCNDLMGPWWKKFLKKE